MKGTEDKEDKEGQTQNYDPGRTSYRPTSWRKSCSVNNVT